MTSYTFGHSALAAERLERVAHSFEPTTRALLTRIRPHLRRHEFVADLGCGPGHTTQLLHEMFPAAEILGVDLSPDFASRARERVPTADIVVGDALELASYERFDLVYARFLLAHLPDVPAAIATWCSALAPGGLLVLEEPESIRSSDPDFARYEEIARGVVHAHGGVFSAGADIAGVTLPAGVERIVDEPIAIDVTAGEAAAMFWRNAVVWRDDAVAARVADAGEIDALVVRLRAREGDQTRGLFDWRHRQTVLARAVTLQPGPTTAQ